MENDTDELDASVLLQPKHNYYHAPSSEFEQATTSTKSLICKSDNPWYHATTNAALISSIAAANSNNSMVVAMACQDRTIRLVQHEQQQEQQQQQQLLSASKRAMTHACIGTSIIAGASMDHCAYVWNRQDGALAHVIDGKYHARKVNHVSLCENNTILVTACHDRMIRMFDLQHAAVPLSHTIPCMSSANTICHSDKMMTMISGHVDGHVRIYDARTAPSLLVHQLSMHHTQQVTGVCQHDKYETI